MKRTFSPSVLFGLVSIFCLTLVSIALPPFIGPDAIPPAVAQTNYFYWEPTNELVSFNGSAGVTYPGYLETVSDATNTTVEITSSANLTLFAATNLPTFGTINLSANIALAGVFFPNLTNATLLNVSGCDSLPFLSLPELLNIDSLIGDSCASLTNVSCAKLVSSDTTINLGSSAINGVDFGVLESFLSFSVAGNALSVLDLSSGVSFGDLNGSSCIALATVSLGTTRFDFNVNTIINFNGDALNEASVNAIMTRAWADTPSATDTIDVSGGTSVTPTGAGFTDYQSLTNAGNTVTINP